MLTLFIIIAGVLLRLVPHIPNIAPIAAVALFGGVYMNRKFALFVPLLIMIISDYFIGFHNTLFFVYASFFLTGLIGLWLRNHNNFHNIVFSSLISSVAFYLITNFGVWAVGTMYPKTMNGLLESYIMAIPFFRNTILGDLFYTGVFFSSYVLIQNTIKYLRIRDIHTGQKSI